MIKKKKEMNEGNASKWEENEKNKREEKLREKRAVAVLKTANRIHYFIKRYHDSSCWRRCFPWTNVNTLKKREKKN